MATQPSPRCRNAATATWAGFDVLPKYLVKAVPLRVGGDAAPNFHPGLMVAELARMLDTRLQQWLEKGDRPDP